MNAGYPAEQDRGWRPIRSLADSNKLPSCPWGRGGRYEDHEEEEGAACRHATSIAGLIAQD